MAAFCLSGKTQGAPVCLGQAHLRLEALDVPLDDRLRARAKMIETATATEDRRAVRLACTDFLKQAADFYNVVIPPVRVLAARPIRVREGGWGTERLAGLLE